MKTLTCLLLFTFIYSTIPQGVRFYVIRQWKYINFTWPDEDSLKTATSTGRYIPENIVISGVKHFEDHFYITLPRMKSGVPATLARIKSGEVKDPSPHLEPFPSWEMNSVDDCNNLQNVQNVEIDKKGQMWIIDGGLIQTLNNPVVKCGPKLIVYDIREMKINTVYQFPDDVAARNGSFLYDLVVDNTEAGFAYITDNSDNDPGIIVYSVKENRSWKIRDTKTMRADPSAIRLTINDITITKPINIAGIALGPKIHTSDDKIVVNEDREVYFSPLSSLHLYSINTSVLRNENLTKTNYNADIKDVGLKSSQSAGMVMDNQGILYYSLLGNSEIGRWDSHTPFQSGQRPIARDNKYLEWPNSFTFDNTGNLTVLINALDRFIFNKTDLNDYNFRLISAFVDGTSYLYDEKFRYDSHEEHSTTSSIERMNSTHREVHDQHDHISSTPTSTEDVKVKPNSGSTVAVSLLVLVLSFFVTC